MGKQEQKFAKDCFSHQLCFHFWNSLSKYKFSGIVVCQFPQNFMHSSKNALFHRLNHNNWKGQQDSSSMWSRIFSDNGQNVSKWILTKNLLISFIYIFGWWGSIDSNDQSDPSLNFPFDHQIFPYHFFKK